MSILRKSKILSIALIIALIATIITPIGSFTASADDFEYTEGDYTYNVLNGEATITKYNGDGGDITIPSTLGGYPVTTIGDNSFYECSTLTGISMPSVTTVGSEAFSNCESLTSVDMPSVTTIGEYAFGGCAYLMNVSTENVKTIGSYAFFTCTFLPSISLPNVTEIQNNAFLYCPSLKNVYIPNVKAIGEMSFGECSSLESIDMPKVTTIGKDAFFDCVSLTNVSMPNIISIGETAFDKCTSLVNINISKSVTDIGVGAFARTMLMDFTVDNENPCYSEQDGIVFSKDETALILYPSGRGGKYTVPNNVTTIGEGAFYGSSLTSINMPSVTTIGSSAIAKCWNLVSVDIPNATAINSYAFYDSWRLEKILMPNVTTLGSYAFSKCLSLDNMSLPNVTEIGDHAFEDCFLTSINMPNAIAIGNNAFKNCRKLTTVSFPRVTTVCDGAFYDCSSLVTVSMPSVQELGQSVFQKCSNLTSITLDSIISIKDSAFYNCRYLESISMPSVQELGQNVFVGCSNLTSVSMDSIISVGDSSFYACSGLKSVYIPNATTIEFGAFDSCTFLTDVYMPKVTTLGRWAFNNCPSLTSIDMPSATSIGGLAFGYCTSLTNINMPKVTTVGIRAFAGSGIKSIDLSNVTSIGKNAFEACENVTICAPLNSYAHQYALDNDINFVELETEKIKSVSHQIVDGKIIFTIVSSAGDYNRIKLMDSNNLKSYIAYTSTYTVNSDGDYVWTIKADAPRETTSYTFDIRSSETNKYLKEYFDYEAEIIPIVKSVSHEIASGKIIFTIVTSAGDYNRVKLMDSDDLKSYIAYTSTYVENSDGDYVWTIKANAPKETTSYTFDIRSAETNKYLKDYFTCEVEVIPTIKSVSHEITDDKIAFTITSTSGDYNRVKLMDADDLKSYIDYTKSYELNANGDYVWTITADAPTETTNYVFDIRNSLTNKYLKDYFYYEVEVIIPTILNVTHQIADGKIVFNVTTPANTYNRVKLALADNVSGYIAYTNSYTLDADGNYVWTIKTDAPAGFTSYGFDVRAIDGNKYARDYYYYDVEPFADDYSYTVSNGEAIITKYNGNGGDVVIPKTLGGYPVSKISYRAFFNCTFLTSIDLSYVTTVEWYAFDSCTSLVSVNMPSVKCVDYYAFSNCTALESVTMNAVEEIYDGAFSGCDNLTIYAPNDSYAEEYAQANNIKFVAPPEPIIKQIMYCALTEKMDIYVTTAAGDYNRVKVMDSNDLKSYIAYTSAYEVNEDGDYVWKISINTPMDDMCLVFDVRSSETNKYLKLNHEFWFIAYMR